MSKDILQKK